MKAKKPKSRKIAAPKGGKQLPVMESKKNGGKTKGKEK